VRRYQEEQGLDPAAQILAVKNAVSGYAHQPPKAQQAFTKHIKPLWAISPSKIQEINYEQR